MKYLLSITLTLCFLITNAQNYTPLLNNNQQWVVEYEDYIALPPVKWERIYQYQGDTIIDNKNYQDFGYNNFLREDVENQHVYYTTKDGPECLLYDFSVQAGETFVPCHYELLTVDSIGEITLKNSSSRKVVYYTLKMGDSGYYVEGIGSSISLIELSETLGPPAISLMCVKQDGADIFGDRCGEVSSINETNLTVKELRVYPNPSKKSFQLNQKFTDNAHYIIRNSLGEEIQKGVYQNTTIDIENLKPSIYSIEILGENNEPIQKAKFVVR